MKPSSRMTRVVKRLIYRAIHASRPVHPVTAYCCGLRFEIASNCRIGEALYANGFERYQRGILDQVVTSGSTVLDIGANLGFYTCLFARKVGQAGQVIAVEPTPKVFQALRHNISINRLGDRVTTLRVALSNQEGSAKMHLYSEGNEVYNSLGVTKSWLPEPPESSIDVDTMTMDYLLHKIPDSTQCFVKIDVEGFQHQVLQGGFNRLRDMPNVAMMVEMNDLASQQCGTSSKDSFELLSECGFLPYRTTDGKSLSPLADNLRMSEALNDDIFFFKRPPQFARSA